MPSCSIINATNTDAKNQPKGNPIWSMPVKSPLYLGGDDSVTVVNVIGDCAPAAVKPNVLAISTDIVFGAMARNATKMGVKKVDHKRDFLLPIRSVRTPTCVHRIPEIKNVIATYQPTSVSDHPKSF